MLEDRYLNSNQLCFFIHDVMVEFIKGGEENKIFISEFKLSEQEKESLNNFEGHILDWLKSNNKTKEYEITIKKRVIPALLSDMLHCIYETLKAMELGKVTIAYMLLRKPIQENLYLFEEMILREDSFIKVFEENPLLLRPKNAGDIEGHKNRIKIILETLKLDSILDSSYLATLRYDKKSEDSFDGVCNQAMHLFTQHQAIKTENLNINFIFADKESKKTLYDFMYSRLPYLMYYIYLVFEQIVGSISATTQDYLADIHHRISAMFLLSYAQIDDHYKTQQFYDLCILFEKYLIKSFKCELSLNTLESIAFTGKAL